MVEKYLQDHFNKIVANKDVKNLVCTVIGTLYNKTVDSIRKKFVELGIEREYKKKNLKKGKKLDEDNSRNSKRKSVEPFTTQKNNEEVQFFLKKMKIDKELREKRQRDREKKEQDKKATEESLRAHLKEEEQLRTEEQKNRKLMEIHEKSLRRKAEVQELIEIGKHQYKKVASSKPMYEKIEEDYYRNVKLPELERHKFELAKKRELFQPIDRSSILHHARKHDLLISEHEIQKLSISHKHEYNPSKFHSKFTLAYIQSERNKILNRDENFLVKKRLASKKKHYADLVLQMYAPTVDPAKQDELKQIKERLEQQNMLKKWSSKSLSSNEPIREHEQIKKRKWKPNKMISESPVKREQIVVDWLAQQRSKKEFFKPAEKIKLDLNKSYSQDTLKKQLSFIEHEVRKKELKMGIVNSNNLKGIHEVAELGDLLIDSIKAKMALLEGKGE